MGEKPRQPCQACGQLECQCRLGKNSRPPPEKKATPPAGPDDRRLLDTQAVARMTAERLLHEKLLHERRQRGEWEKLREFEMNYEPPDME